MHTSRLKDKASTVSDYRKEQKMRQQLLCCLIAVICEENTNRASIGRLSAAIIRPHRFFKDLQLLFFFVF